LKYKSHPPTSARQIVIPGTPVVVVGVGALFLVEDGRLSASTRERGALEEKVLKQL
jgi:hypothetical protein